MAARDRESQRRESNRISKPIAELAILYAPSTPGEFMMLKYYGRQFDIAASTGERAVISDAADNVRRAWSTLRPNVEARGGAPEAQRFNDFVNSLKGAYPPGQLGPELRDRIYEIQDVLKRPLQNSHS